MELKEILTALKNGDMSFDDAKRILNHLREETPENNTSDTTAQNDVLFAPGKGTTPQPTPSGVNRRTSLSAGLSSLQQLREQFEHLHSILAGFLYEGGTLSANNNPPLPEITQLNKATTGQPVFWFHAALGTGEIYHMLAQTIERPFYGIHARGWINEAPPLRGVVAMAAYYIHAIQRIQPTGPYDLGGYSLGGLLAYEVTRQLQQLGHTVRSIVMLDALYVSDDMPSFQMTPETVAETKGFGKGVIFQTGNFILSGKVMLEAGDIFKVLIHNHELDWQQDEEAFETQLIQLFNERIRNKVAPKDLSAMISRCMEIRQAFEMHQYTCRTLENPDQVTCYYFRNKSRQFYGELMHLFATPTASQDHKDYWEGWRHRLTNLHILDMNVNNHFMLLTDPAANDSITRFCQTLYALQPPTPEELEQHQQQIRQIHGN